MFGVSARSVVLVLFVGVFIGGSADEGVPIITPGKVDIETTDPFKLVIDPGAPGDEVKEVKLNIGGCVVKLTVSKNEQGPHLKLNIGDGPEKEWVGGAEIEVHSDKLLAKSTSEASDPQEYKYAVKFEKVGRKKKVTLSLENELPPGFQVVALNSKVYVPRPPTTSTTTTTPTTPTPTPTMEPTTEELSTETGLAGNTTGSFASAVHVPIGLVAANLLGSLAVRLF